MASINNCSIIVERIKTERRTWQKPDDKLIGVPVVVKPLGRGENELEDGRTKDLMKNW